MNNRDFSPAMYIKIDDLVANNKWELQFCEREKVLS